MIHISLQGTDRILGMVITLPQVPARGDKLRVGSMLYLVKDVTWYDSAANYQVSLTLEILESYFV